METSIENNKDLRIAANNFCLFVIAYFFIIIIIIPFIEFGFNHKYK